MEIGYCKDCNELNYALPQKKGVFESANMSNNHIGHNQITFGATVNYSPPISVVLTKLQAQAPISHNEIVLFKLALQLEDIC